MRLRHSLIVALLLPSPVIAGMPSTTVTMTDMASIRLENISFFLFVFFVTAYLIRLLWNFLRRDWPVLPHLSYRRALGLTAAWGLVFVIVLTMISGARELMTPAAWDRDGRTYKVADEKPPPVKDDNTIENRREHLRELRNALWDYAVTHDGLFPSDRGNVSIPTKLWKVPSPSEAQYLYAGGLNRVGPPRLLVWEPELFEGKRLALTTDGIVHSLTNDEIDAMAKGEKK